MFRKITDNNISYTTNQLNHILSMYRYRGHNTAVTQQPQFGDNLLLIVLHIEMGHDDNCCHLFATWDCHTQTSHICNALNFVVPRNKGSRVTAAERIVPMTARPRPRPRPALTYAQIKETERDNEVCLDGDGG